MNDERLTNLEIKFAHQDEFLDQLNKIVITQQARIERLEKEMLELRRVADPESTTDKNSKPPHY